MRHLLTFWVLLLCLSASAQVKLADEPKLQVKITVWVKLEPLRDVLRELSQRTGVPLQCQDAIQHEKVSIFVENRPAHEILTQLSELLRYSWRLRAEGGYILYVPEETRLQEERFLRALRNARRQALQDLIKATREVIAKPPQPADRPAQSRPEAATPYEIQRTVVMRHQPWRAVRSVSTPSPSEWLAPEATVLAFLVNLPRGAVDALLSNKPIGLSTRPAVGIYPFPEQVLLPIHLRQFLPSAAEPSEDGAVYPPARLNTITPDYCGAWLRLGATGNTIEYEILSLVEERSLSSDTATADAPTLHRERGELMFHLTPYVGDHAWLRSWSAWAMPPSALQGRFPNQRPAPRSDRPEPNLRKVALSADATLLLNAADALEWLAWATRTPIIADAYRTDAVEIDPDELSPRHALDKLAERGWLRLDEAGYLLRRAQNYLHLRTVEIPEDALRPLERKFQKGQWLTVEDYTALAARLNDTQANAYEQGYNATLRARSLETLYGRIVTTEFPFDTLAVNIRAWRFLAALSPAQRRQALTGEWQSTERLTPSQRTRFLQALQARFPEPELLFTELPPYQYSCEEELYFTGFSSYRSSEEQEPTVTAMFRLRSRPETLTRLEATSEYLTYYFYYSDKALSDAAAEPSHQLPEAVRPIHRGLSDYDKRRLFRLIEDNPNLTLRQFIVYGDELELAAPPNRRRTYYLLQGRRTPVALTEVQAVIEPRE